MNADTPHSFTDSCIIFMFFKSFMVNCIPLCSLLPQWCKIGFD